MRKKYIKVIFTVILMLLCMICITNVVCATSSDNFDFNAFDNENVESADNAAKSVIGTAITVIRVVATGVSIIMLTYIAIKYMMAAPSEKADFKRSAAIYIVGAVLIFGAGNLLTMITSFFTE